MRLKKRLTAVAAVLVMAASVFCGSVLNPSCKSGQIRLFQRIMAHNISIRYLVRIQRSIIENPEESPEGIPIDEELLAVKTEEYFRNALPDTMEDILQIADTRPVLL